ncbi:MAG: hypothetical protein NC244_10760 [Alistipes senegalensis]|nr:hypothetical protein [Alistipes senegalensis]
MKRQKMFIIFSILLAIIVSIGCKENSENKTESITDIEFSENISESSLEIFDKIKQEVSETECTSESIADTEFSENISESSLKISDETKQEVSETEYTSENIAGVVTAETTQNSNDVIIREEIFEDILQSDMPIIKYDNYEQVSPVTTAESKEYEEVTTTQSIIELPFVPVM